MRMWSMWTTWRMLKMRNEEKEENQEDEENERKHLSANRRWCWWWGEDWCCNWFVQYHRISTLQKELPTDPTDAKEQNHAHPSFVCSIEVSRMRYRSSTSPKPSTVRSSGRLKTVRVVTVIHSNTSWSKPSKWFKWLRNFYVQYFDFVNSHRLFLQDFVDCTYQGN